MVVVMGDRVTCVCIQRSPCCLKFVRDMEGEAFLQSLDVELQGIRKRKFFHNYQRSREFDYLDMVDAKKNRLTGAPRGRRDTCGKEESCSFTRSAAEEMRDVKVSWSTVEELRSNVFDIPSFREGGGSICESESE